MHLTLTVGQPLTAAPSLTGADGRFHSLGGLVARLSAGAISMTDVRPVRLRSVASKTLAFSSNTSTAISMSMRCGIWPAVRRALLESGLAGIRVRAPVERLGPDVSWRTRLKAAAIAASWRVATALVR
ncbi:MAG: hypothetical protein U0163_14995 [Gemmatimonadaceae bacterium]